MSKVKLFLENYKLKRLLRHSNNSLSKLNSEYCKLEKKLEEANYQNHELLDIIEEMEIKGIDKE